MRTLIPAIVVATLLAGPLQARKAEDPEAKLAKALAGRTPGKPVDCISLFPGTSDHSQTIPGAGILYGQGSTLYLNRFDRGCSALSWDSFIVTRTPSNRLCRGDIAEVRQRSMPGIPIGSCAFGSFTPYQRASK